VHVHLNYGGAYRQRAAASGISGEGGRRARRRESDRQQRATEFRHSPEMPDAAARCDRRRRNSGARARHRSTNRGGQVVESLEDDATSHAAPGRHGHVGRAPADTRAHATPRCAAAPPARSAARGPLNGSRCTRTAARCDRTPRPRAATRHQDVATAVAAVTESRATDRLSVAIDDIDSQRPHRPAIMPFPRRRHAASCRPAPR